MDQAARGATALSSGDFQSAIAHYTDAISSNPEAVDYYIKRSTAYTRVSPVDHEAALKDSETAVVLATKRARRELISQAQMRRGIALFGLERWADAKKCFQWVQKMAPNEKSLVIWDMKVDGKLKALAEGDERATVSVKELPELEIQPAAAIKEEEVGSGPVEVAMAKPTVPASIKPDGVQTPASKIRHEWYQQPDDVIVTLFAKGIPKDKATVEMMPTSLEMSFPLPSGSDFHFSIDPLFSSIDPAASSYKIMSTKAEFTLKKATSGSKWSELESSKPVKASLSADGNPTGDEQIKRALLAEKPSNTAPAYPTSSKSGPKNWDKVASDLTKKSKKERKEGTGSDNDEGGIDDEEGDAVNGFFKTLYKGADDDTRRAMIKSYQESNGTALSTNWSEVSKATVETTPPDGMEAKNWGS